MRRFLVALVVLAAAPAGAFAAGPPPAPAAPPASAAMRPPASAPLSPPAGSAAVAAPGGQTPALLDADALPLIWPLGREQYRRRFLVGNLPRAFAIAENGQFGGRWAADSLEQARSEALKSCTAKGGTGCKIYAENLDVVWPGRPPVARVPTPGPLLAGAGWSFVPDARYLWRGPAAAPGVVVFVHGYSDSAHKTEGADAQPPPYIRAFNNAGFDVVRFARPWRSDSHTDEVAQHLREGLRDLRRRGWKTIVVAGQSRGAWNSLQMLDTAGLVDAVIAMSPVVNVAQSGAQVLVGNPAQWPPIATVPAPNTRVIFGQFRDDPYDIQPEERLAFVRRLRRQNEPLMVIDRPADISGHDGADKPEFAEKFGACLVRFATAPQVPSAC